MSETECTTKESLDSLLHSYTVYVLKISRLQAEPDDAEFANIARKKVKQLLSKKKAAICQITQLFQKESSLVSL